MAQWTSYLTVIMPAAMIVYLEWFFFELNTVIIALLGSEADLAGHTSMVGLFFIFYMIPHGFGDCVNQ